MELKPIRTKRAHEEPLKEIEALWDTKDGTPEADRLEVLVLLVEAYEAIGTRARVAEVLNRVQPLTLDMIRALSEGLNLPIEVLVRRYELRQMA